MDNQDGVSREVQEDQVEDVYPTQERDIILNDEPAKEGILDLVYGVLFDPHKTFAGIAIKPRISTAVLIFIALNILEALMGFYTTPRLFNGLHFPGMPESGIRSILIMVAFGGFVMSFIKWFIMSGLLHLLAAFWGGSGNVRSVFTVCGLAGLPALFMIPVQVLMMVFPEGFAPALLAGLIGIGLYVWSAVLLAIGLKEVHHLNTGMAVMVILTPGLMLLLLGIVFIFILSGLIASYPVNRYM